MFNLGGFVPKNFSSFAKDPAWSLAAFASGYWFGEYYWMNRKLNSPAIIKDPRRYMYNPKLDH